MHLHANLYILRCSGKLIQSRKYDQIILGTDANNSTNDKRSTTHAHTPNTEWMKCISNSHWKVWFQISCNSIQGMKSAWSHTLTKNYATDDAFAIRWTRIRKKNQSNEIRLCSALKNENVFGWAAMRWAMTEMGVWEKETEKMSIAQTANVIYLHLNNTSNKNGKNRPNVRNSQGTNAS